MVPRPSKLGNAFIFHSGVPVVHSLVSLLHTLRERDGQRAVARAVDTLDSSLSCAPPLLPLSFCSPLFLHIPPTYTHTHTRIQRQSIPSIHLFSAHTHTRWVVAFPFHSSFPFCEMKVAIVLPIQPRSSLLRFLPSLAFSSAFRRILEPGEFLSHWLFFFCFEWECNSFFRSLSLFIDRMSYSTHPNFFFYTWPGFFFRFPMSRSNTRHVGTWPPQCAPISCPS